MLREVCTRLNAIGSGAAVDFVWILSTGREPFGVLTAMHRMSDVELKGFVECVAGETAADTLNNLRGFVHVV